MKKTQLFKCPYFLGEKQAFYLKILHFFLHANELWLDSVEQQKRFKKP